MFQRYALGKFRNLASMVFAAKKTVILFSNQWRRLVIMQGSVNSVIIRSKNNYQWFCRVLVYFTNGKETLKLFNYNLIMVISLDVKENYYQSEKKNEEKRHLSLNK